jgi:hypothetical protein
MFGEFSLHNVKILFMGILLTALSQNGPTHCKLVVRIFGAQSTVPPLLPSLILLKIAYFIQKLLICAENAHLIKKLLIYLDIAHLATNCLFNLIAPFKLEIPLSKVLELFTISFSD